MSLRSDLLCRNGCGFFGNPEWQWFCSKCWREHQLGKQGYGGVSPTISYSRPSAVSPLHTAGAVSQTGQQSTGPAVMPDGQKEASNVKSFLSFGHSSNAKSPVSSESQSKQQSRSPRRSPSRLGGQSKLISTTKVEDKKKKHTFDQNLKQMFQKGRAGFGSKESPEKARKKVESLRGASTSSKGTPTRSISSDFPPEAKVISNEFASFLRSRLERPGITEISRYVKAITEKIIRTTTELSYVHSVEQEQIDQLSALVQEFYQKLQRRLESKHAYYHALTEEDILKILDYAEKYVMICCYRHLFCPTMTNDEDKDLELQARIRNLNWISTKDLHCSINESSQDVRDLLYEAINDILEIDGKLAPQDKMECLTRCSKKIFDMLKISNETPASADDFLPCLIYICLKANPPRIQSNINFVTRFCNENKLRMGEGGYFFANLCCAMSYIENMTAESINIDPEEFESYVTGKSVPPGSWRTSLLMCDGLQITSQNLKMLAELRKRHDSVMSQALQLQAEMGGFQKDVEDEVKAVLDRTKFTLRQPKKPIRPDADVDESDTSALPPPLTPQNVQAVNVQKFPATTTQKDISLGGNIVTTLDIPFSDSACAVTPSKVASGEECEQGQLSTLLEDYDDFMSLSSLCTADDISLLSVDVSNSATSFDVKESGVQKGNIKDITLPDQASAANEEITNDKKVNASQVSSVPAYRGLTAQIGNIPSIACDNSVVLKDDIQGSLNIPGPEMITETSMNEEESSSGHSSATSSPTNSKNNELNCDTGISCNETDASCRIRKTSGGSSSGELSPIVTSTPSSSPLVSAATSVSSSQIVDKPNGSPQLSEDNCDMTTSAESFSTKTTLSNAESDITAAGDAKYSKDQ